MGGEGSDGVITFICFRCGETRLVHSLPEVCPNRYCRAVKYDETRSMEKMCAVCNTIFEGATGYQRFGREGPYCSIRCKDKMGRMKGKARRIRAPHPIFGQENE